MGSHEHEESEAPTPTPVTSIPLPRQTGKQRAATLTENGALALFVLKRRMTQGKHCAGEGMDTVSDGGEERMDSSEREMVVEGVVKETRAWRRTEKENDARKTEVEWKWIVSDGGAGERGP